MAQITVNGKQYELVPTDDMTLEEADTLCDYAKVPIDQIGQREGLWPGEVRGLIHVAVARGEPGETAASIRRVVAELKTRDLNMIFMDMSEEVAEVPPPNAPEQTAPTVSSGETSQVIGVSSPGSSGPNGSGSPGSDTGQVSAPRISVG